jgi:hypothetical protein
MSELLNTLKRKFIENRPILEANIGGQCLPKALELRDKNKGGTMYWVGSLDNVGLDFGVQHAYYVPPNAKDTDMALNRSDNGYDQYPALTVGEVKLVGQPMDVSIVRETVRAGKRR